MVYPAGAWNLDEIERSITKNGKKISYAPLSCEVDSLGYAVVLLNFDNKYEILRKGTVANDGAPNKWKIQVSLLGVRVTLPLEI